MKGSVRAVGIRKGEDVGIDCIAGLDLGEGC